MSTLIRSISLLLFLLITPLLSTSKVGEVKSPNHLNSIERQELKVLFTIEEGAFKEGGDPIGFHIELLKQFAEHYNSSIKVLPLEGEPIEQLRGGKIDLLIRIGEGEELSKLQREQLLYSDKIAQNSEVWLLKEGGYPLLKELNFWFANFTQSGSYSKLYRRYHTNFRHFTKCDTPTPLTTLSPYDRIIKEQAKELGWDWRLLASLIYQESKFRVEAISHRNAVGIMQLMPNTAKAVGVENPLNPEESIRGGAQHLKRLLSLYSHSEIDSLNRVKLTLAAYNAGEGRVRDIRKVALHKGLNPDNWESLKEAIPYMRDGEKLPQQLLKHGNFKGRETINYVEEVIERYENYKVWVRG